jgi:hypothetical protein
MFGTRVRCPEIERGSAERVHQVRRRRAKGRRKKDPPPELAERMGRFEQLMAGVVFIDLKDPWLY